MKKKTDKRDSDNKVLNNTIRKVLSLFGIKIDDEKTNSIAEFIKFCFVGLSNTVISYLLNVAVLALLEKYEYKWDFVVANIVAFLLSVLWSFFWNNKYVFTKKENEDRSILKSLLKTYASYFITGIVLTNVLSYVWIEIVGLSKYIAPIINLVITIPLNFLLNKKWAFK